MRLAGLDDITSSYVLTLRKWREALMSRQADVKRLGLSDQFLRMWEFYFCYCEGGFAERAIGDVQLHFKKPLCQ
jgi:cyclopropane-fatty-acyl-phospholipid synthase